jgi:hypothetical protein
LHIGVEHQCSAGIELVQLQCLAHIAHRGAPTTW